MRSRWLMRGAVVLCSLSVLASQAHARVRLTWGTPAAGTAYAIGATISYSGQVTWVVGADQECTGVSVELIYWDCEDEDNVVVVDSEFATMGTLDPGSITFSSSGDLTATQYNGKVGCYYLSGVPLRKGLPYPDGSGGYIYTTLTLGTIS